MQALARQTGTEGRTAAAYRDDFLGRLATLARAHELAFAADDAAGGADLGELVRGTLAPYAADPARLAVDAAGPAVAVGRGRVTPVCLILHELATNAVKHGALSVPAGRVRVGWRDDPSEPGAAAGGRVVRLRWEERGGPEVRPPAAPGFGTRLVEFAAARELHGRAELTFAPAGLRAEIAFPVG